VPGEGMQPPLVYMVSAPLLGGSELDVARASEELDRATRTYYTTGVKNSGGGPSIASYQHGYRQWVTDGRLAPLQVLRFTSLAFGLLAVIFTFAAMWRLTHDARLALLAGSLLAFNPQFLFGSGYFSNDTAAASLGAVSLWLVVRALEEGVSRRHYVGAAVIVALGAR
jgi:4-amino-4-deoxy-L-arabinose transferase-like glycosyltransferase